MATAKQKIAERRRASAAAFSNLSALGQGVKSIPGRVVNYIKTTTPSGVARDVGDVAASTFSALKDDPAGFIGDAIFSPFAAVRDIGDLRAKAAELRRRGLNAEAQKLEALAGTMVLSAIPVVGRVAGTAVRDAEKAVTKGALSAAEKRVAKSMAVKALPAPPKPLALPAPGPGLPPHAVKPRGGQFWPDADIQKEFKGDKLSNTLTELQGNMSPEAAARFVASISADDPTVQTWLQRALAKYYKTDFGSPDDPLRSLAERGLHYEAGMTPERWQRIAKEYITADDIGAYTVPGQPDINPEEASALLKVAPWLSKQPVTDKLYGISGGGLEVAHLADEIKNALNPEASGLPPELALRPESLDRMSFAAAAERVGRINQFRVKQMQEAALNSFNNPAVSLLKEYPEDNPMGLRWVELKAPDEIETPEFSIKDQSYTQRGIKIGDDYYNVPFNMETGSADYEGYARDVAKRNALQEALKYEGDTMGHCVGGYCPDVMSGRSRIFSLRDAKGEPHVTIETAPYDEYEAFSAAADNDPLLADTWNEYYYSNSPKTGTFAEFLAKDRPETYEKYKHLVGGSDSIIQIKGKQNRAPKDDYLPLVQDFVKSQQWSNVGDLENTGLVRLPDGRYITQQQWKEGLGSVVSPWRDPGQYDERYLNNLSKAEWEYMAPYFEGFAIGGRVERDRCFCRHPMAAK